MPVLFLKKGNLFYFNGYMPGFKIVFKFIAQIVTGFFTNNEYYYYPFVQYFSIKYHARKAIYNSGFSDCKQPPGEIYFL